MRIDYRDGTIDGTKVEPMPSVKVINRNTGEAIVGGFLADDVTGEYGCYLKNEQGVFYCDPKNPNEVAKRFGKAPLLILLEKS